VGEHGDAEILPGGESRGADAVVKRSPWSLALIVRRTGCGTYGGAVYSPLAEMVPTTVLPSGMPFTAQSTGGEPPPGVLTLNCCVVPGGIELPAGVTVKGPITLKIVDDVAEPAGVVTLIGPV